MNPYVHSEKIWIFAILTNQLFHVSSTANQQLEGIIWWETFLFEFNCNSTYRKPSYKTLGYKYFFNFYGLKTVIFQLYTQ